MNLNRTILLVFFLMFAVFTGKSQKTSSPDLEQIFGKTGEVYFRFSIFDRSEIQFLTRIISIDNVKGNDVFAYANKKQFSEFLEKNYKYTILPHPGTLLDEKELNMGGVNNGKQPNTIWNFYPTYPQYVDLMNGFATAHPDICKLDTFGVTQNGRLLLVLKISDSVNTSNPEPQFLYTSTIHGDETTGYVLMLHLIDSLLSGYNVNPRITNLINNTEIFINPLANPDGTYHGGNSSVSGAIRENANYVDLNRNFADPKVGPHPDGNTWQPETKAFMALDSAHDFVMSMNFHGGSEVFNYPWDTWFKHHADDAWFQFIGHEWADTVKHYGPAGYFTDVTSNGISNGYAWYEVNGGRQDYTTYFHFGREVTLEISEIKTVAASQLLNYWKYNRNAFLNYMEEVSYGINGKVTDSVTGLPLDAKIMISGHDIDNSQVYSTLPTGWYYRPIIAGTYTLVFSRTGYITKTITGVSSVNHAVTRLNVKLVPTNIGVTEDIVMDKLTIYPNPSAGKINVLLPDNTGCELLISVSNVLGNLVFTKNIAAGNKDGKIALNLEGLQKGIYIIRVEGGKVLKEQKLVIH